MNADKLIAFLSRKVYRKGHLRSADGSLYMERYSVFETKWLSARVHHIHRPDKDDYLHDHPWWFLSIVLRGGYLEERPVSMHGYTFINGREPVIETRRNKWSIGFRHACDRHRISEVDPKTVSLFVYGPIRQWWGFFLPIGKLHWKTYLESGLSSFSKDNNAGDIGV